MKSKRHETLRVVGWFLLGIGFGMQIAILCVGHEIDILQPSYYIVAYGICTFGVLFLSQARKRKRESNKDSAEKDAT
jgi:hypothetical protein